MTTVAVRDGVMASDSRFVDNHGITNGKKIFRKKIGKKEHLIGICGDVEAAMMFVDWYGSGDEKLLTLVRSHAKDFGVLIWTGTKILACSQLCGLMEVEEEYYAVGSGSAYAITAMDCGKNAATAVKMAAKRDPNTGGRVVTASLT
jgi:ATP-dependent protease HslVU (ClpYQ) peptidase subunit